MTDKLLTQNIFVMPGLDPGIQVRESRSAASGITQANRDGRERAIGGDDTLQRG
jgi:hypothetical protein